MKINHEHLLYVKKNCIEGVAVYTADGIVISSNGQEFDYQQDISHHEER